MLRLNSTQRDILLCGQMQAEASYRSIAQQTGTREHTVRYAFEKFESAGLIHRYPYINIYPLGLEEHGLFFSLAAGQKTRRKVISAMQKAQEVAWVLETEGDFNFGLAVCAKNSAAVVRFLNNLSETFGDIIVGKLLSVRVGWTLFPRQYLSPRKYKVKALTCGPTHSEVSLDERDHAILSALSLHPKASLREVANKLSLPSSTVQHRVQQLKKNGIIQGFAYEINPEVIGAQGYRLLLYASSVSADLKTRLYRHAQKHKHIFAFIECIGSWDYELKVETESSAELQELVCELYEIFKGEIIEIKTLTIIRTPKLSFYPS